MRTVEIAYRFEGGDAQPRPRPVDAEDARRRLEDGNRSFAALFADAKSSATERRVIRVDRRDLGLQGEGSIVPAQRPYAAIVGCADARVPIELVFNEGPNDLFVVRVAGNTLGDDVLGSLKYAVEHLGDSLKLIAVLGHSACGAVSAAVDVMLNPAGYLSVVSRPALRMLVDRLQVVVQVSARRLEAEFGPGVARHPAYREALIETAVVTNAALAAHTLQQELRRTGAIDVGVAYGVYVLAERLVWGPRVGSADVDGLAAPPVNAEGFVEFSHAVMRAERIARLMTE